MNYISVLDQQREHI